MMFFEPFILGDSPRLNIDLYKTIFQPELTSIKKEDPDDKAKNNCSAFFNKCCF